MELDHNELETLLAAVDHLAAEEPSNLAEAPVADPENVEGMKAALKQLDTPSARRLGRQLEDRRQAVRRLKRASQDHDRAEQAVIDTATELAGELRGRDA